jgi:2-polyprenyl-6-methoxyphenol hydroxylase-like FAD-dependent oxidoreductase
MAAGEPDEGGNRMTRVLVIGGGIAGTAAALAITKAGLDVTVFEAHPDSGADIGAFLTLADNGMRALAQFDAADVVAAAGFPLTRMSVVGADGTELAAVPLGGHEHPLTSYRCLRRAELGTVLRAEVTRRGIPIRHSARLDSVAEGPDDVTVRFTDGSTATGDIVVAADGLNSRTRSLVDPAAPGPRYAGQHVWYGYTVAAQPPTEPERITMLRGSGSAFGYCVSPAGETFWFARVTAPEPLTDAEVTAAEWLLPVLERDRTPAADIVAVTDQLMATNASDLVPGLRWYTDRTVLIGDAAHAASPATGQGASMALEDAVVLAKALRDAPATPFSCYDRFRRPRVERNIEVSAAATAGRSSPGGRSSHTDETLAGLLDWHTPLGT